MMYKIYLYLYKYLAYTLKSKMYFSNITHSNDKKTMSFKIRGMDTSIVNGLRRTLLSDIPVVAFKYCPTHPDINDITILKNTGSLHNEFIGHRMSLVPLCFSQLEVKNFQPSLYKFVLKCENTTTKPLVVTTRDIKVYTPTGDMYPPEVHDNIFPMKSPILLTKLMQNQELHIEGFASIGTARDNAGRSAVSLSVYEFAVDEDLATKKENEIVEPSEKEDFRNLDRYRLFKQDADGNPTEFNFSIESACGMACDDLVDTALDTMSNGLNKIITGVRQITHSRSNNIEVLLVEGINHTLGNIVSTHLQNKLSYAGYNVPHPLEESCIFKFTMGDGDAVEWFKEQCGEVKENIDNIRAEWNKVRK